MITFLFFKLLMAAYSFDKDTVNICSGIFAFLSCLEFLAVIFAVCFNFSEVVTFIKGVVKKSKEHK